MKSSKDIIDNIINLYEAGDITSILNNSDDLIINNSNVYGAILNYCSNFELNNNSTVIGSVVSNYLVNIDNSSTITKGNLPSFYGKNIGLSTSIVPGSYLEY